MSRKSGKGNTFLAMVLRLFSLFHLRLQSLLCSVHKAVAFLGLQILCGFWNHKRGSFINETANNYTTAYL